jgi:hypothetical protein
MACLLCKECKSCHIHAMELITAQYARDHWASCLEAVYNSDSVFGVTYFKTRRGGELVEARQDPAVVLLSPELWARGEGRVSVPSTKRQEVGAKEGRLQLRDLRELAGRGMHTVISRYGKEQAVIAPYGWAVKALPEIAAGSQSG